MNLKMDTKSIIIFVLFILLLIVALNWYFTYDGKQEYKTKIEQLHNENDSLIKKRDSIDNDLNILKIKYDSIARIDSLLTLKIKKLESDIEISKKRANESIIELSKLKLKLDELRQKIEELKKNPPYKTEDELLESLKNKI